MPKNIIVLLIILNPITIYSFLAWQRPTNQGYVYTNELAAPSHNKILIFSYGSLVKQKENKKTGDLLLATDFQKTVIQVPVSFTFLAGCPLYYPVVPNRCKDFPYCRATITIDSRSHDYKALWSAWSEFKLLNNARNNLAAREGAPFLGAHKGYELKHILYIRKLSPQEPKKKYEVAVKGFSDWVTLKPHNTHQKLSNEILQDMVTYSINNNADAAIWTALPSNIDYKTLDKVLNENPLFIKNTYEYIQKLPPENKYTTFEQKILNFFIMP